MSGLRVVLQPVTTKLEMDDTSGPPHLIYLSNLIGNGQLIINGGGVDTTDWTDTNTDGLADYWLSITPP